MKTILISVIYLLLLQACNNGGGSSGDDDTQADPSFSELVRDIFNDDENDLPRIINDITIIEDSNNEDFSDLL